MSWRRFTPVWTSRWAVATVLIVASVAGCISVSDVALDTAVRDLRCPKADVRVDLTSDHVLLGLPQLPARYLAVGCGHWLKYVCYSMGRSDVKCFPDQPPRLHDIRGPD